MENQHRKITGYRELSQAEIDLMNKIKALGPVIDGLLREVELHAYAQCAEPIGDEIARLNNAQPHRWIAIARTDFQTGLMALTRAVAQPTFF